MENFDEILEDLKAIMFNLNIHFLRNYLSSKLYLQLIISHTAP